MAYLQKYASANAENNATQRISVNQSSMFFFAASIIRSLQIVWYLDTMSSVILDLQ